MLNIECGEKEGNTRRRRRRLHYSKIWATKKGWTFLDSSFWSLLPMRKVATSWREKRTGEKFLLWKKWKLRGTKTFPEILARQQRTRPKFFSQVENLNKEICRFRGWVKSAQIFRHFHGAFHSDPLARFGNSTNCKTEMKKILFPDSFEGSLII